MFDSVPSLICFVMIKNQQQFLMFLVNMHLTFAQVIKQRNLGTNMIITPKRAAVNIKWLPQAGLIK